MAKVLASVIPYTTEDTTGLKHACLDTARCNIHLVGNLRMRVALQAESDHRCLLRRQF